MPSLDNYLIACGSPQNITHHGRTFLPDSQHPSVRSDYEHSDSLSNSSISVSPIYQSARTFTASASYNFDVNHKGWHFIRLYFHPLSERLASVSFSVVTETHVLLDSFRFNTSDNKSYSSFREYAIYVNTNLLILTFVPSSDSDIAFVNAIEVLSVPDEIFSFNHTLSFPMFKDVSLETMYRLNMGGPSFVPCQNDTLFRVWEEDDKYLKHNPSALNLSVNPHSAKAFRKKHVKRVQFDLGLPCQSEVQIHSENSFLRYD
ncbi:receptor-like protein kinase THESEUS 1 [Prosopis cineraria]|uniref:receptor-like protein kinase THESEUS 1 n=1 Tax=Prosopis cineraria TaxID=364024 RepID=UPI00240EE55E|nr:receptor-like protein kinase THESEUS 1 [Prosopis cineraria]